MGEDLEHDRVDMFISERAGRVTFIATNDEQDGVAWASLDLHPTPGGDNVDLHVIDEGATDAGAAVLNAVIDEARRRGVPFLRWTHGDDVAARRMLRDARAIRSRRVADGRTRDVLVISAA